MPRLIGGYAGNMSSTVAVLGAGGTMGLGMSRNIRKAGMQVRAWNRSREKADPLAGEGPTGGEASPRGGESVLPPPPPGGGGGGRPPSPVPFLWVGDAVLDVAN